MSTDRASDAVAITARLLDTTGRALISGDFAAMADCFRLPQSLATIHGSVLIETREDLRTVFDSMRGYLARQGVTRLDRHIEKAVFDGPDMIRYSHISRFMNGETATQPPFASYSVVAREGCAWRIVDMQYAINNRPDHLNALQGDLKRGAALRAESETTRKGPPPALDIFQRVLDGITQAYLDVDFESLMPWIQLPLFMQSSDRSDVHVTEAAMREAFVRRVTALRSHGVNDFVRLVKTAEFIGDTRIHGTYRTHVLRDTHLVAPSYVSAMTLEQGADKSWRATTIVHPMGHLPFVSAPGAQ